MVAASAEIPFTWTDLERAIWAPPPKITVSEWAAAERRIISKDAAIAGPWRNELAPYAAEVMDCFGRDSPVQEVYWQKPARVAGTEVIKNVIGYYARLAPRPVVLKYPREEDARQEMREEIVPLLKSLTGIGDDAVDQKRAMISLPTMNARIAWSASPSSMARFTAGAAFGDEIDKDPPYSGREASPGDLLKRRLDTWGDMAKFYETSTPTTPTGAIVQRVAGCSDRRYWWTPCPHCHAEQRMAWSGMRWAERAEGEDRVAHADRIRETRAAWYECVHCKGRIEERHKFDLMQHGRWLTEDGKEPPATSLVRAYVGPFGPATLLGRTFAKAVSAYLKAVIKREQGDLAPLMEHYTQGLGEPFRDQVDEVDEKVFAVKASRGHKPLVVPRWAGVLLATADTQRDHFRWLVRAWGPGEQSRKLAHGRAETFEQLERMTLGARFQVEGWPREQMAPAKLYIDAGGGGEKGGASRTDEVYQYALSRGGRVQPVKGWGGHGDRPGLLVNPRRIRYDPKKHGRAAYDVNLLVLDTQSLKDILANWIAQVPADPALERWQLAEDRDAEYEKHMVAEAKEVVREGGILVARWKAPQGKPRDFWDCEVYQVAAARWERVAQLPALEVLEKARFERNKDKPPSRGRPDEPWVDGSGWWDGNRR